MLGQVDFQAFQALLKKIFRQPQGLSCVPWALYLWFQLFPIITRWRILDDWYFKMFILNFKMTISKEEENSDKIFSCYVVIGRKSDSCRWALGSSSCHSWFVFFPKPKHRSVFNFVILGLCQKIMANSNQPRAQLVWRWVAQPWAYSRGVPHRIFKNSGQTCRHP